MPDTQLEALISAVAASITAQIGGQTHSYVPDGQLEALISAAAGSITAHEVRCPTLS